MKVFYAEKFPQELALKEQLKKIKEVEYDQYKHGIKEEDEDDEDAAEEEEKAEALEA
jgi:hypothetical protein